MRRKQESDGLKQIMVFCLLMMWVVSPAVYATQGGTPKKDDTASSNNWQFEITPYAFAAAVDGTVGVRQVKGDVSRDFEDIWDSLDSAGMLALEARKGPWAFLFDGIYIDLSGERFKQWSGPGGIGSLTGTLEASTKLQVYQPALGYRVMDGPTKVDVIGGARYTQLDVDLDLVVNIAGPGGVLPGGSLKVSEKESWWDPIVGARVLAPIAEKWAFIGYADIGGFNVGSDLTYQLMAGVKWQMSEVISMKLAYRYLYQDYAKNGLVWDMAAYGPVLGLGFSF